MRLEKESAIKLKQEIKSIFAKHLDKAQYHLFFFGSRVAGRGNEYSDIDIGIEGPQPLDPITKTELEEALENLPILYKIDLVDFAAPSITEDFKKVALQDIETIE